MNENGEIIICLCDPSPQSMRMMSEPPLTAIQDVALSRDGTLAPVPRKSSSNMLSSLSVVDSVDLSVVLGLFLVLLVVLLAEVHLAEVVALECELRSGDLLDVERSLGVILASGYVAFRGNGVMLG